jgi:prepilin-type N-terminal cleavage/methylation domain-containing protein
MSAKLQHRVPGRKLRNAAFTLVELMIVVSIIGLLLAIAIPKYNNYKLNAKVARTAAEMRGLSAAFVAFKAGTGVYPIDSHLVLPPGMEDFINPAIWANETPLGGHYNWEGPDFYPYAGLAILNPTAPPRAITTLDQMLDDGDLNTGRFRWGTGGRPTLIIEE